jgi:hypothetical protein
MFPCNEHVSLIATLLFYTTLRLLHLPVSIVWFLPTRHPITASLFKIPPTNFPQPILCRSRLYAITE